MPFGGVVKLTGEEDYRKALERIQANLKVLGSELKLVSSEYDKNDKSMAANKARADVLRKTLDANREKLAVLTVQHERMAAKTEESRKKEEELAEELEFARKKLEEAAKSADTTRERYDLLQAVVDEVQKEYNEAGREVSENIKQEANLQSQMNDTSREIVDTSKKMDDLGKSTDDSSKKAKDASSKNGGWSMLKQTLSDLTTKGVEIALSAMKELGKAAIQLGKDAVESYAQQEQLVGSVDRLYKAASDRVQTNARNAFKTMGMSSNEYMEQVMGFSNKLLEDVSGNTWKAADMADMALRDMMDNSNAFGGSLDAIRSAYENFAAGQYGSLEKLRLGFKGNAEGMAELINQSGVMGDAIQVTKDNIDQVPFDKIILAIHTIQEEMKVTGATAEDSEATISGSLGTMKAAWENLVTGLADDTADYDSLIEDLLAAVTAFANNIVPRIQTTITGMSTALVRLMSEVVPKLAEMIPPILQETLPILVEGIKTLLAGALSVLPDVISLIAGVVPDLIRAITELTPLIVDSALKIVLAMLSGLKEALPVLLEAIPGLVREVLSAITNNYNQIIEMAFEVINAVIEGLFVALPELIAILPDIVTQLGDAVVANLPIIMDALMELVPTLMNGMDQLLTALYPAIEQLLEGTIEILVSMSSIMVDGVEMLIDAALEYIPVWLELFKKHAFGYKVVVAIVKAIWDEMPTLLKLGEDVLLWIGEGIVSMGDWLDNAIWGVLEPIVDKIEELWTGLVNWFNDKVIKPIGNFFGGLWGAVKQSASNAWTALKDGALLSWEGIKSVFAPIAEWFRSKFSEAWEKVKNVFSAGGKIFTGIKEGIEKAFKSVVNAIIRGINSVITKPFNAINNMLDRIRNVTILGLQPFRGLVSRFSVPSIPQLARGGVLERGQIGFLEGSGAEAVVPLENNTKWIRKVAEELRDQHAFGGTINITVNGAKGQDVNELADIIAVKIQKMVTRREAAYA